ncbi:MAG: agmatine deiminase family protein [Candidatus Omnitrophica bacterium]|nr:agmatine deiminase family protein [Candidatus Omnitrophota bacterium]
MIKLKAKKSVIKKTRRASTVLFPAEQGYRMPAEWEAHEATWLTWPRNKVTWPGKKLKEVEEIYLQMMEALLPNEKVHLLVPDETKGEEILQRLARRGVQVRGLKLHLIPAVDTWIRDYGPTFLKNRKGQKAWCKWIFNAWGRKYRSLMRDDQIFRNHQALIKGSCFATEVVLEGGSIEVNGKGTCLVTEQCLLNKNRNPRFSREQIDLFLQQHLGVSQVLWLGEGIVGDDTDGHIDDITRFCSADTIITAYETDRTDDNFRFLDENWKRLKMSRTPAGGKWNLIKLPMPGVVAAEGERLPASYANFYIANGVVLLPIYGHANDRRAIRIIREAFPGREVVPIRCETLVYGLGSIHCVTQQEPR